LAQGLLQRGELGSMIDWKARALAAERKLDEWDRHGHPMPDYFPGCSECEEDKKRREGRDEKGRFR
jgi:hypothetical protein